MRTGSDLSVPMDPDDRVDREEIHETTRKPKNPEGTRTRVTTHPSTQNFARRTVRPCNKTGAKISDARSCSDAAERLVQLPTPNAAADAATVASRGQYMPNFGQHLGLPWYLAGASDCPAKAPRSPVALSAVLSF